MRNAGLGKSKNRKNKKKSVKDFKFWGFLNFMEDILDYTTYSEMKYALLWEELSEDHLFMRAASLFYEAREKDEESFEKLIEYIYQKRKSDPGSFFIDGVYKIAVLFNALVNKVDLEAILFFMNEDMLGILTLEELIGRNKDAVELAILMLKQGFDFPAVRGFLKLFTDEEISKIKSFLDEEELKIIKENYEEALAGIFSLRHYLLEVLP